MRSRYLTEEEIDRLSAKIEKIDWLPFRLMLETGIRVGDAVKARRRDFFRGDDGKPRFRWVAEKTGKQGECEISEHLFGAVVAQRKKPTAWVFSGRGKAGHITRQALWARMKAAAHRARLDDVGTSPHSFRKVAGVRVRRSAGFTAAKAALQHTHDSTAALYAYADAAACPDAPITWGEVDMIAEFVAAKVMERLDKGAGGKL